MRGLVGAPTEGLEDREHPLVDLDHTVWMAFCSKDFLEGRLNFLSTFPLRSFLCAEIGDVLFQGASSAFS